MSGLPWSLAMRLTTAAMFPPSMVLRRARRLSVSGSGLSAPNRR
jgi:hypothetical protein